MLHLFETCRHLLFGTTIYEGNLGTEALGCTAGIHSGISTTYDDDVLTEIDRCICLRISGIHKVDAGEILVGRHDIDGILAWYVHEVGKSGTRAYEDTLEAHFLEFLH